MFGDGVLDGLPGADDGVARFDVALFAEGEERGPAARDEGAGAGAGHGGRAIDAAGPVGRDEVAVLPQLDGAVEDDAVAFWCEAVFVRVDADARDARLAEVEAALLGKRRGKARGGEEGEEEAAQAAVDVERDFVGDGYGGEGRNVVDYSGGVVGAGADDEDCVGVYEAADVGEGDGVVRFGRGEDVEFYAEVLGCFVKCAVETLLEGSLKECGRG